MLDYALEYANRGWPVFPATPGKKRPATEHGLKDATTDEVQIRDWWRRYPNANIAIATGPEAGFYVLDVDPRHGGDQSLSELCAPTELPDTPTCETGGGGKHIYLLWPEDGTHIRNATNIVPGLDIRGAGGYVIAPPSNTWLEDNGGAYVWESETENIAPTPAWLMPFLSTRTKRAKQPVKATNGEATRILSPGEKQAIPEGSRDETLTRIAGAMRRHGSDEATIYTALVSENDRCEPPLPEEDLERIAQSVARYEPALDTYHYTDSGNAERLVSLHGKRIRYCFDWGTWIIWDGVRWQPDRTERIRKMASDVVRTLYVVAAELEDKSERKALIQHASSSEGVGKLRAMIELAQPRLPIVLDELDADPWLMTTENATIDLRDCTQREVDPADFISKKAAVTFDAYAEARTWEQFLQTIFNGDTELIQFVQKAAGYSMTGDVSEQCLFVCYGVGSNGKSTFLSTIQDLLGDYANSTPPSAILQNRSEGVPNDIARLRGVRFTSVLELEQGRRLNEPLVKGLTGGDVIAARFLHQEFFDLKPQFKMWLGTNHKPNILGADHGIWRRMRLIPFTVTIPDDKQDKHLLEKLRAERSGILNWMLDGLEAWHREGLEPPQAVREATAEYRTEEDILGEFLEESVDPVPNASVPSSDMYGAYTEWCERNGEKTRSQRWLSLRLEERGYERVRTKTGRVWRNLRLVGRGGDA